eukprot:611362-Alexandrium_andersonii.AAC.1
MDSGNAHQPSYPMRVRYTEVGKLEEEAKVYEEVQPPEHNDLGNASDGGRVKEGLKALGHNDEPDIV